MEPSCVCPRGQQHHRCGSLHSIVMRTFDPFSNCAPVWRIAPTGAVPGLNHPILFRRIIFLAFGVLWQRANVQIKMEFVVQLVKKNLRRLPQICFAGKHQIFIHHNPLHNLCTARQLMRNHAVQRSHTLHLYPPRTHVSASRQILHGVSVILSPSLKFRAAMHKIALCRALFFWPCTDVPALSIPSRHRLKRFRPAAPMLAAGNCIFTVPAQRAVLVFPSMFLHIAYLPSAPACAGPQQSNPVPTVPAGGRRLAAGWSAPLAAPCL